MRFRRSLCITLVGVCIVSAIAFASDKNSGETRYVTVVVTDKAGNPVPDLPASAFTIQEDGKPATIASVTPIKTAGGALPAVAPGVTRNLGASITTERPVTLVVIDMVDTPVEEQNRTNEIVMKYVLAALQRGDSVSLAYSDAEGLHPIMSGTSSPISARRFDLNAPGAAKQAASSLGTGTRMVTMSEAIATTLYGMGQAGQILGGLPGRKTVFWLTSRMPFSINTTTGALESLYVTNEGSATGGNVTAGGTSMLYSAEKQDLLRSDELKRLDPLLRRAMASLQAGSVALYPVEVPGTAEDRPDTAIGVDWRRQTLTTMKNLAAMTGGRALAASDLQVAAFEAATHDSAAYYRIAYQSEAGKPKPFRKLAVKVQLDGAKVLAPIAIQADPVPLSATRQADIAQALRSTMEFNGLPLTVFWMQTAEEKGKKKVGFQLVLPPEARIIADDGKLNLDVVVMAKTTAGQNGDQFAQTLATTLPPVDADKVRKEGLNYGNTVLLAPGEYSVRFVVRDAASGRVGAVTAHLKVS